jgi:hypothetical protein
VIAKPILITSALTAALFLTGCSAPLHDAYSATLLDVNPILNDTTLTPQQKRDQLEALGFSPTVINGLLRNVRTGNQFGGDLRTAYDKVTGGRLDELTPDEVQIYADEASSVSNDFSYTLSDEAAQDIVWVFQTHRLTTAAQLDAFLADPDNVLALPGDIPDGALEDIFVTFDPAELIESLP